MKDTVRLNFDFPKDQYPFLKMACAMRGTTFRNLVTELLMKAIEEIEDEHLAKLADERLANIDKNELVSWDEATKLAGW